MQSPLCAGLRNALGRRLPQPGVRLAGRQADRVGQLLDQQGDL